MSKFQPGDLLTVDGNSRSQLIVYITEIKLNYYILSHSEWNGTYSQSLNFVEERYILATDIFREES